MSFFINENSTCKQIMDAINWENHPLGKQEEWPQSLLTTLSVILHSKFPMFLFWGPELYCFYNDAYRPSLGKEGKHPHAIGKKGSEVWPEIWDIIYPQIKQVMDGGEATWHEDALVPIYRNGKIEEVYWTYSYSPVMAEQGQIAGVFVTCNETTSKVLAEKHSQELALELELQANELAEVNQNLSQQNSLLKQAEAIAQLGSFEWDLVTGKIIWSEQLYNILGLKPGEVEPSFEFAINKVVIPEEQQAVADKIQYCRDNKLPYIDEINITRPDGSIRNLEIEAHFEKYVHNTPRMMIGVILDITNRKSIETEKKELASVIENSLNEVYIFDTESLHFKYVNKGALINIGYNTEEITQLNPVDIKPEYTLESFKEMLLPLQNGEKDLLVFTTVHQRKNGSLYPVEVHLQKMSFQSKPAFVAIIMDITEKNKESREKEIIRIENEALINTTSDLIWSIDTGIKLLSANQAFLKRMESLTGKTLQRGENLLLKTYFPKETLDPFEAMYTKVLAGESISTELQNQGEWVEINMNPIYDNKNITGAACYAKNITERKKIALQLQNSENKYRLLFENSPLPKLMYDLETLAILDANHAAIEIYGYSKDELLQMTVKALRPEADVAEFIKIIDRIRKGEMTASYGPLTYQKKNKEKFTAELNLHSILFNERPSIIAVVNDVTDKLASEKKLKDLNQSLLSSNYELQHFAAVTAHDLQEPLRMVSNFTGQLDKKYGHQLDEKAKEYIHFAVDGAKRMHVLINDILEYSKVGSGELKKQPVDVDDLLASVLKDIENRLQETGAKVDIPKMQLVINGNKSWLYRLFLNLLSNAIKFTKPGTTPEVKLSLTDQENYWQIGIQDNGIGIAADDIPKLFQTYTRLHTRYEYAGTGLGLATCKKIVELHGGNIWVTSEPGKGSCFFIQLIKSQVKEQE